MINPQELRIGNWVKIRGQYYVQVIDLIGLRWFSYMQGQGCDYEDAEPITLTPTILEKVGFTPNAIGTLAIELWDISTHLEIIPAGFAFYVSIDQMQDIGAPQNVSLQCISYVHELQNLIYFLTKKELQIDSII